MIATAAFKARCFVGASRIQNHHLWLQLFVCQAATVVPGDRAPLQLNANGKSEGPQADELCAVLSSSHLFSPFERGKTAACAHKSPVYLISTRDQIQRTAATQELTPVMTNRQKQLLRVVFHVKSLRFFTSCVGSTVVAPHVHFIISHQHIWS